MVDTTLARTPTLQTERGRALFDLVFTTARAFFRLRAAGSSMGAVTPWGGGLLGLLHGLKVEGPKTVPQIARARPVSRQRIQKLANEMADEGLIEFFDNPAHKRSKLLRLTPKGEALYNELTDAMLDWCEEIAADMEASDIETAQTVLDTLIKRIGEPR